MLVLLLAAGVGAGSPHACFHGANARRAARVSRAGLRPGARLRTTHVPRRVNQTGANQRPHPATAEIQVS